MPLLIVPLAGAFFGAAFAGCLVGVVMTAMQIDTYPDDQYVPARELRKLTERLRHPWRARLARFLSRG